jgi:hypothetical protein
LTTAGRSGDRRAPARSYDALLPELHPLKLVGASIAADFLVGRRADGVALDARVSPRRMLAWLRSMPSYRAGVPLRLGHDGDPGLAFQKCAELIELADPGRPVVYPTHLPFTPEQRRFLGVARPNLLVEPTATPRRAARGAAGDPLDLVRSAAGLDPRALHWVLGPLAAGDEAETSRILEALPPGSRITLRPLGEAGPDEAGGASPPGPVGLNGLGAAGLAGLGAAGLVCLGPAGLARLEAAAHARGHAVTEWTCRGGLARVGQGFFDVDRLTGQADLARRAHDLITCAGCPSRTQCHGPLDEPALLARLGRELRVLGLSLTAPPARTGPRAWRLEVAEPAARGDEAYLSHALGQPVAVTLSTAGAGGRPGDADAAVLRRWYATGFLPVTELNAVAERVLEDLGRRRAARRKAEAG